MNHEVTSWSRIQIIFHHRVASGYKRAAQNDIHRTQFLSISFIGHQRFNNHFDHKLKHYAQRKRAAIIKVTSEDIYDWVQKKVRWSSSRSLIQFLSTLTVHNGLEKQPTRTKKTNLEFLSYVVCLLEWKNGRRDFCSVANMFRTVTKG